MIGLFWWFLLDLKIIYRQWEHTYSSSTSQHSQSQLTKPNTNNWVAHFFQTINYKFHLTGQFILVLLIDHTTPVFLLFNMLAVLLGTFVNIAYLAMSLFSFISIFNSMFYVVKAIAINSKKLLYLIIFTCILFFSFSLISHVFFRDAFTKKGTSPYLPIPIECDTLEFCYLNTLQIFFINNEGVGSEARQQSFTEGNYKNYYAFMVFQLVFFMLVNVMIINIIQAFIVDTFSDLRQQEDEKNNDIQKFCFICGLNRFEF